ncbi:hypothetical protein O3P69_000636 [Scylla paramamosain]|uniref:Uncharacterized protein n=1 Tax=Scylla paramamosain TaxID=85552 RepID=A0AAW0UQC0_SCYPA
MAAFSLTPNTRNTNGPREEFVEFQVSVRPRVPRRRGHKPTLRARGVGAAFLLQAPLGPIPRIRGTGATPSSAGQATTKQGRERLGTVGEGREARAGAGCFTSPGWGHQGPLPEKGNDKVTQTHSLRGEQSNADIFMASCIIPLRHYCAALKVTPQQRLSIKEKECSSQKSPGEQQQQQQQQQQQRQQQREGGGGGGGRGSEVEALKHHHHHNHHHHHIPFNYHITEPDAVSSKVRSYETRMRRGYSTRPLTQLRVTPIHARGAGASHLAMRGRSPGAGRWGIPATLTQSGTHVSLPTNQQSLPITTSPSLLPHHSCPSLVPLTHAPHQHAIRGEQYKKSALPPASLQIPPTPRRASPPSSEGTFNTSQGATRRWGRYESRDNGCQRWVSEKVRAGVPLFAPSPHQVAPHPFPLHVPLRLKGITTSRPHKQHRSGVSQRGNPSPACHTSSPRILILLFVLFSPAISSRGTPRCIPFTSPPPPTPTTTTTSHSLHTHTLAASPVAAPGTARRESCAMSVRRASECCDGYPKKNSLGIRERMAENEVKNTSSSLIVQYQYCFHLASRLSSSFISTTTSVGMQCW